MTFVVTLLGIAIQGKIEHGLKESIDQMVEGIDSLYHEILMNLFIVCRSREELTKNALSIRKIIAFRISWLFNWSIQIDIY